MTLTCEQRIEAYTYALFCALAGFKETPFHEWEAQEGLWWVIRTDYKELYWFDRNKISALCRAIEQCEKSKV